MPELDENRRRRAEVQRNEWHLHLCGDGDETGHNSDDEPYEPIGRLPESFRQWAPVS